MIGISNFSPKNNVHVALKSDSSSHTEDINLVETNDLCWIFSEFKSSWYVKHNYEYQVSISKIQLKEETWL